MKLKYSLFLTVFTLMLVNSCFSQPKSISINEFKEGIGRKDSKLIDIRTPDEFNSGHIQDAININFYGKDFESEMYRVGKNFHVLIYCASGNRSGQALNRLNSANFKSIEDLKGGIRAWVASGNPITKK